MLSNISFFESFKDHLHLVTLICDIHIIVFKTLRIELQLSGTQVAFMSLIIWGGQLNASNSKETFLSSLVESPKLDIYIC